MKAPYRPVPRAGKFARTMWLSRIASAGRSLRQSSLVGVGILVAGLGAAGASAGCQNGTITPQTQAEIQASLVLGDCIESVFVADSQKVPAVSPVQIAIDEGTTCGADVANLVSLFGQSTNATKQSVAKAAQDNAATVHNAAMRHVPAGS